MTGKEVCEVEIPLSEEEAAEEEDEEDPLSADQSRKWGMNVLRGGARAKREGAVWCSMEGPLEETALCFSMLSTSCC